MDLSSIPVIFIGTFFISYILLKVVKSNTQHPHHLPPSLHHLPIVGSIPFLPNENDWPTYFLRKSKEIGTVFGFYIGSKYAIVLNSKKDIHNALVKRSSDFAGRPMFLSTSHINSNFKGVIDHQFNAEFRRQHQVILSVLRDLGFGSDIMETRILGELSSLVQRVRDMKGESFWPDSLVSSSLLNVILSVVVGYRFVDSKIEDTVELVHSFIQEVFEASDVDFIPLVKFLPSYRRSMLKVAGTSKRLLKLIEECIATCSNDSFIKFYMDREGSSLDHEQLTFIIRDLLIAGTETSASSLMWSFVLLANNPNIQDKMRHEIDSVVSKNELCTLSHKARLPYVEAVMYETMRIKTITPLALFHETMCDTTVGKFFVPAKTMVIPNLYAVHMDTSVWSDPLIFRPERFLDESGNITNKDLIMPFSIGRRSCLAEILARQEVFLFLSGIVQNFVIEPPLGEKTVECKEKFHITLSPTPFRVRFVHI